jgi:hypothetical protein
MLPTCTKNTCWFCVFSRLLSVRLYYCMYLRAHSLRKNFESEQNKSSVRRNPARFLLSSVALLCLCRRDSGTLSVLKACLSMEDKPCRQHRVPVPERVAVLCHTQGTPGKNKRDRISGEINKSRQKKIIPSPRKAPKTPTRVRNVLPRDYQYVGNLKTYYNKTRRLEFDNIIYQFIT